MLMGLEITFLIYNCLTQVSTSYNTGVVIGGAVDPFLTWEKTASSNFGLEFDRLEIGYLARIIIVKSQLI
jgi:hypothetical protein